MSGVFVMQEAMARGGGQRADSIEALATSLSSPLDALIETLGARNALLQGQVDQFGRPASGHVLRAPWYAARITGAVARMQGGLVIDASGRVLREDGAPIPRLFAVGNTIAGLSGDSCTGYLSGNGLLLAYTSGCVIARHLAQSLGKALSANH